MNPENRFYDDDRFQPHLDVAIQTLNAEPLPDDAIERVKARAVKIANASPVRLPLTKPGANPGNWRISRRSFAGLAIAAMLLLAFAGAIQILNHSAGRAFAAVIEKVKAAGSASLTMSVRMGHRPETDGKMYLDGNRIRLEQFHGTLVMVTDLERNRVLVLDAPRKLAQLTDANADVVRGFADPLDQLRHAKSADAVSIGQEILDGHRTQVYRLNKVDLLGFKGNAQMLVWVDDATGLPVKIVIHDADPKAEIELRFEKIAWNEPLDNALFAMNVPEGFKSGEVVITPPRGQSAKHEVTAPAFADGVLRDRVPGSIVWNTTATGITSLMRDPESVPQVEQQGNELRNWDMTSGKMLWSESVAGAGSFAQSADGKLLATVIGYEVQLRDAATGKITRKWATSERLSTLAFSPDGKTLAAGITEWGPYGGNGGKMSGGVQFWDVEQGRLLRTIIEDKPVTFIRYSIDGKYLATATNVGSVKLWKTETGELVRVFPGSRVAEFSPDGAFIACNSATSAGGNVGTVELYRLDNGSLVRSYVTEKASSASTLLCITFSPDGRLLVTADWNGSIAVWNARTVERIKTIADNNAGVHCAVFSPDGAKLAIGREDKTLRVINVAAELGRP